jgi:uncharacterized membrane protein
MKTRATFLLILSALLFLLATPVVAQDGATEEPIASPAPVATEAPSASEAATQTLAPMPTLIPASDGPTVQAVFYFSPNCGHCHKVITEDLPGLFADNGGAPNINVDQSVPPAEVAFYLMSNGQLQMLVVDVTQPAGQLMYVADSEALGFEQPPGVPLLHAGDEWFIGSGDIPDNLPRIVGAGLAADGLAWPPAPGIEAALAPFLADGCVAVTEPSADDEVAVPVGPDESALDKFDKDPVGNGISVIVLIALLGSLVGAPILAMRGSLPAFPSWLVIVLVVIGAAVAAYLANIETSGSEAVCGPVGDCNAVQESEYAELFGIPIGVLGVIGYVFIGGLWLVSRISSGAISDWADVLIAAGAFAGTLFSAYLTFLEPFVIGATCMWCITSAVVMMALLWISVGPAWAAIGRLRGTSPAGEVTAS